MQKIFKISPQFELGGGCLFEKKVVTLQSQTVSRGPVGASRAGAKHNRSAFIHALS